MKCIKCGTNIEDGVRFCPQCGLDIFKEIASADKYERLSFALAMIPVMLYAYCYISSGGSFSESGDGFIFFFFYFYLFTIGLPISLYSANLGLKSYRLKGGILSIISIILGSLPSLIFIIV